MNYELRMMFLDWVNNYLTVEKFAADNGVSVEDARALIEMGRKYHEEHVEENRA